MEKAKSTRVLLEVPKHGIQQDFAVEHAERLLRMPNNGGWVLPEDSPFVLTSDGLRPKSNKERDKGK